MLILGAQKLLQADKMETPNNRAYFEGMLKQARKNVLAR
jgi:hypothetical protein